MVINCLSRQLSAQRSTESSDQSWHALAAVEMLESGDLDTNTTSTSQSEVKPERTKMAPKRHAASNPAAIAAAAATTTATASSSSPSSKVTQRSTHSSPGLTPNSPPQAIIQHIWQRYLAQTPQRTLLLDAFMAFLVLVGGIQFVYCVLAGNYVRRSHYVLTSKPPPLSFSCLDFQLLIIDCWVSLLMRS